jgi:hypothetical protein
MAVGKASDSAIGGKKYRDASAGTTKIADVPDQPTIGAISDNDGASASVSITQSNTGGNPASFLVTASPGGATGSGNSPVIVSPLDPGTAYTFTAVPRTSNLISGPTSSVSSSFTIPAYELSQTFNTSGNYTVPSGKTKLAIKIVGGGGNGGNGMGGRGFQGRGGGGGGGGGVGLVEEITVTAGTNYAVNVGAGGGGQSKFGNIVTANGGGNGENWNTGTAGGGGGGSFSNNTGTVRGSAGGGSGVQGTFSNASGPGGSVSTINTSNNGVGSFSAAGGGGAGGGGGHSGFPQAGTNGGAGGNPFGGAGGGGINGPSNDNAGGGQGGRGIGGGGGGAGSAGGHNGFDFEAAYNGGGGGAAGRVIVYAK